MELAVDATVNELSYGKLKMSDARGRMRLKDQRATLEAFQMNAIGGQIGVEGYYETTHPDKPTFDVALKMTKVDIPSAFRTLVSVQKLAPAAKYATGNVTTDMRVNGALGKDMMPLFANLSGGGTMETSQLAVQGFPLMKKIVDVTRLQFLNDPTLQPLKAAFQIPDCRLFLRPFDARVGGVNMKGSGSNGLAQS